MTLNTAFFISGSGTTLEAVLCAIVDQRITGITPVVVISNRPDALGLVKAEHHGVPAHVVAKKRDETQESYGERLLMILHHYNAELISQNGWMPLTPENVVDEYKDRIMNQHPGPLDPGRIDFGGTGMFGRRVTCARIAYSWLTGSDNWTEATTHMVTRQYDQGALIRITKLEFDQHNAVTIGELEGDREQLIRQTEDVSRTLLSVEHENVIATLAQISAKDSLSVNQRINPLVPLDNEIFVYESRRIASVLYPKG